MGQTALPRLMESHICHQPVGSVALFGGGSEMGQWPAFLLRECCPPALILMPDTSLFPCMSLVSFKLLLWFWSSEGVSLMMSLCGFFRRNCLRLQKFLPLTQSLVVCGQKLWRLIFLALECWAGGLVWVWDFSLPRYLSQIFIHMGVGPAHSMFMPLPPVWMDKVSLIP